MENSEITRLLWTFCLENSVKFGGKPNVKAVLGKLIGQNPELRSQIKGIKPILDEIVLEISKLTFQEQEAKLLELKPDALEKQASKEEKKTLPELPNAQNYDKIVMRLAPYPSGALHIGNARMVILNSEYTKKYNGDLILFFDDTIGSPKSLRNTSKAKYVLPEAYELIEDGLKWLEITYSKVFYKSNRLEIYYEYCEKLIQDNMAYVCFCTAAEFKNKYKDRKQDCPHRNQTLPFNLKEWENMLKGKYHEMEVVVRLKTGMKHKDPALRDQIIMRISEAEHPLVGTKYLVWPMLEFSWAIDDYLIGVSHIIRGSDLIKEDLIEDLIWDHFGWKKAEFIHYGRLNFSGLSKNGENLLSKTKARNNIANGTYSGWDDPRTWSLQSLKMRGIQPKALKDSLLDLGLSINAINFSVNWLYSKNKDIIDEQSNRYFFVEEPAIVEISDVPFSSFIAEPMLQPTDPQKGRRKIRVDASNNRLLILISGTDMVKLNTGQIIRLKDLLNIQITSKSLKDSKIQARFHSYDLNRDYNIIHWVPKKENVKVSIIKTDGTVSMGNGEKNLQNIPLNKPIQFERYGFVNPIKWENQILICYFTH
ncbi:MAG TPA: glutamate--tRNA ligase [Candidatus Nanopelagicaceae bacterium]|nr:glutamate--tRNA ligase [Candidatus Nanopelagicaceae bacterium]